MRIAFLTPEYVTEQCHGGLANYLQRTSHALCERGHEVEVFTRSERDGTVVQKSAVVHRVPAGGHGVRALDMATRGRFRRSVEAVCVALRLRRRLTARHAQRPFDVVQVSSYDACGFGVVQRFPAPVVTRLSSFEPLWRTVNCDSLTMDQRLIERLEVHVLRRSTVVYAPSRFLAAFVERRTGLVIDVIPPPFLLDTTAHDERLLTHSLARVRYFVFFGQLGFKKGVAVLADALATAFPKCPGMHFVLAGPVALGPGGSSMLEYLLDRVGSYRDRVHYLGVIPHARLYPVVERASAVVLPSLVDNLPNACLEAMALGRVVIGTRGTSLDELLDDGTSGVLVPPGDATALAGAIVRVWGMQDDQRQGIGHVAREQIARFSPATACARLEACFRQACATWSARC